MSTEMNRESAAAALDQAGRAAGNVRRESSWMVRYLALFAVGFGGATLLLGMVQPLWLRMTLFGVLWIPLVVGGVVWGTTRRATSAGVARRVLWGWIGTGLLYAVALFVGTPGQIGNWLYWIPAAVVVALPLAIAAVLEARR